MNPKIYPVLHYLNHPVLLDEAQKAVNAGADGVFVISHQGDDVALLSAACAVRLQHPDLRIGVNLLSTGALDAAALIRKFGFPMMWGDHVGVDSTGLSAVGEGVLAESFTDGQPLFEVFASVAFKYRPHEPQPGLAALNALKAGFIPTTSGSATGAPPELQKIVTMSEATGGVLAVASGMTPENVAMYAPYLSHILVATGVAIDEHTLDVGKLKRLIASARS